MPEHLTNIDVRFTDLGKMRYKQAWEFQTACHRTLVDQKLKHRNETPGTYPQEHTLIFVEHDPVYTLGKSGSESNLLLTQEDCQERGIDYLPVNRGGDITYHGPGQLVGYPIFDLECFFTDIHRYVRYIEEIIIQTLRNFGVEAYREPGYTGVWIQGPPAGAVANPESEFWNQKRKICAIGVHLSRWVTLHGFAFNINPDLAYFSYIVPCGIADTDKTVTSLSVELGRDVSIDEVKPILRQHFSSIFQCRIVL